MDRILMEGMSFFGFHGVHPAEREMGAHFRVDAVLHVDLASAGRADSLDDTVDYSEAYERIREIVEGDTHYRLLEALAERIAAALLEFERVQEARVVVRKRPPLPGAFEAFGVEVIRTR